MLLDLANYDALVYWKTDRLVRRTGQFWKVMEACDAAGVRLVSVLDPVDTSTPIGRGVASLLASVGEQESHNTGTRVKRRDAENAQNGRPHGHRRAFGYANDGMTIVREEADAIREACDRILRGESMRSICTDWNERGVKPVSAPAWRVSTFKRMITGTRIASLRKYQGEAVAAAAWPALITPEQRERVLAILGDPRTRSRGRPASYLLTGLVRCGRCHAVLRSGVRDNGNRKWSCQRVPGDESRCGKLSVRADHVDTLIEDAILYRLDSPALAKALKERAAKKGKVPQVNIADLEARITQLGIDHDEGLITRKEWLDRRAPLTERLEAARAALVPNDTELLDHFAGTDVRARWATLSLETRRKVARALIEEVSIAPARGNGNTFNPERVIVSWRS
jgi:hypothetical protein